MKIGKPVWSAEMTKSGRPLVTISWDVDGREDQASMVYMLGNIPSDWKVHMMEMYSQVEVARRLCTDTIEPGSTLH